MVTQTAAAENNAIQPYAAMEYENVSPKAAVGGSPAAARRPIAQFIPISQSMAVTARRRTGFADDQLTATQVRLSVETRAAGWSGNGTLNAVLRIRMGIR